MHDKTQTTNPVRDRAMNGDYSDYKRGECEPGIITDWKIIGPKENVMLEGEFCFATIFIILPVLCMIKWLLS